MYFTLKLAKAHTKDDTQPRKVMRQDAKEGLTGHEEWKAG